jgi:hypothetical protein
MPLPHACRGAQKDPKAATSPGTQGPKDRLGGDIASNTSTRLAVVACSLLKMPAAESFLSSTRGRMRMFADP